MRRDATGKFVNNWNSETKRRVSVSLTSTAWRLLKQVAQKQGISRSEVIEQFARNLDTVPSSHSEETQVNWLQNQLLEQQQQNVLLQQQQQQLERQLERALDQRQPTAADCDRQQVEALLEELQRKERQQRFLIELNDTIRAIQDPKEMMWQVVCATGQYFNVTRCTYGEIDSTQDYVIVDRDYCNGVISVVGRHQMEVFGSDLIAELKQGKTVVVDDIRSDSRTVAGSIAAFDAIQTQSLLCVPLVRAGRFLALLGLHHAEPRQWTTEDRILMERVAAKTWLAVERSQAEEALHQALQKLNFHVENTPMGVVEWDCDFRVIRWSAGAERILGWQAEEILGKYLTEIPFVFEEDQEPVAEVCHRLVHGDEPHIFSYNRNYTKAHEIVHCEWYNSSLRDESGRMTSIMSLVLDVTERKQAEQEREQLLERERIARSQAEKAQHQLTILFETSPVGLALLDAEQRFMAINEALAELNGLSRDQLLGMTIPDLFSQVDPKLVEVLDQVYVTGEPFISPDFAMHAPGRSDRRPGYYNVYYLPTTNSNHQVESTLVYVVDVTERVKLERTQQFLSEASAVLASSLDYQTTLERVAQLTVPELADWCTVHIVEETGAIEQIAVAHIDPDKLVWADELRQKYPLDPKAARGTAFTLRTGQADLIPEIPDQLLVQAAQDADHLDVLRQVGFTSAMTVPLQIHTQIIGVISFISAESGRRYTIADLQFAEELAHRASLAIENAQLYREAQRDRAKAEAANRIKDEFLAVLSHELRSPLNPILGWTKMLRQRRLDAAKTEQALETIERNAKLQAQLIEDLLDVSRILQGKMTLNMIPVNLTTTINAALETVRLAAEAKKIHLHTTFHSLSGSVLGDSNRLQQVIWNLLSNAVKFTQPGGQVAIQLEQVGMYAQIQVKDTGKGIHPNFLPHVFDYFRQEDSTITRHFGGLGLGLAIVRQLTELHGGTVWVESPGANLGAIFTVQLPLDLVSQELPTQIESSGETITLTNVQILVVDDDADMRELASFILTQAGARVMTAASAMQALTLLKQAKPDLLLCDIGMPEMNGYDLIQHIRKGTPEQGANIPAIALTAYAGEMNQQQALATGFQMHVAKPVEPECLVQAIVHLLHPNHGS